MESPRRDRYSSESSQFALCTFFHMQDRQGVIVFVAHGCSCASIVVISSSYAAAAAVPLSLSSSTITFSSIRRVPLRLRLEPLPLLVLAPLGAELVAAAGSAGWVLAGALWRLRFRLGPSSGDVCSAPPAPPAAPVTPAGTAGMDGCGGSGMPGLDMNATPSRCSGSFESNLAGKNTIGSLVDPGRWNACHQLSIRYWLRKSKSTHHTLRMQPLHHRYKGREVVVVAQHHSHGHRSEAFPSEMSDGDHGRRAAEVGLLFCRISNRLWPQLGLPVWS